MSQTNIKSIMALKKINHFSIEMADIMFSLKFKLHQHGRQSRPVLEANITKVIKITQII